MVISLKVDKKILYVKLELQPIYSVQKYRVSIVGVKDRGLRPLRKFWKINFILFFEGMCFGDFEQKK